MHMLEALEVEDAKRWKEHAALVKVAESAAIAAEFLHGISLGSGGLKVLYLLDKSLNDLDEVVK